MRKILSRKYIHLGMCIYTLELSIDLDDDSIDFRIYLEINGEVISHFLCGEETARTIYKMLKKYYEEGTQ